MEVLVRLFGHLSDSGLDNTRFHPAPGDTVADLAEELTTLHPRLANVSQCRAALNLEYVSFDAVLNDGDEIAFIPPMSGG